MLCKIADVLVEIPAVGDLTDRCQAYLCDQNAPPDMILDGSLPPKEKWPDLSEDLRIYLATGFRFSRDLLKFGGFYLHSSAVLADGRVYLFSGPCGMGKSTHARLWLDRLPNARIINDDKPALRCVDGVWYAYGTPWCGKDGINSNERAPLGGICFLRRGSQNRIRRLPSLEAVKNIFSQTTYQFKSQENMLLLMDTVDRLVQNIPVFELECLPDSEAAALSYNTMSIAAKEAGL